MAAGKLSPAKGWHGQDGVATSTVVCLSDELKLNFGSVVVIVIKINGIFHLSDGWENCSPNICERRTHEHRTTRTQNHTNIEPHEHRTTRTQNHTNIRPHEHTTTRTQNHTNIRPHEHRTTRTYNHTDEPNERLQAVMDGVTRRISG